MRLNVPKDVAEYHTQARRREE